MFEGLKFYFYGEFDGHFTVNNLGDFVYRQGGKVLRLPEKGCYVVANNVFSDLKDVAKPQDIEEMMYEDGSEESDFEGREAGGDEHDSEEEEEKKEKPREIKLRHKKKKPKKLD